MRILMILAASSLFPLLQDKDNPQYQYWAKWKVGAWAKHKMEMNRGGQAIESETVTKLLEMTEEKAVVEQAVKTKFNGQEMVLPPRKQDVKAKEPAEKIKIQKEGDEEIEIAGKKFASHWYEFELDPAKGQPVPPGTPGKMKMKAWMVKEIPGGLAKSEMTPEGAEMPMMKMVAVEWGEK